MLIPLSWLKEYVKIDMPFEKLAERMSEVGLTIEAWHKDGDDIIFDPEVTPNRPDWLSVVGIAREVAAATNSKFEIRNPKPTAKPKTKLELDYKDNPQLCPRTSRILIKGVKVKPSPDWLQKRIKQIGLRPINNLVDITNYVLWMYGNPLHVFDYDKIRGHKMECVLSRGNEEFRSLDGVNYKLPEGAIIIKDLGRVIDLLPLKGGENTSVSNTTTNILLHSIVCDPVLTRRTSQALGLRSDASAVSERGVDPNGTTRACLTALELILELAGGEVASELIETPKEPFANWKVKVTHEEIENVLGVKVSEKEVKDTFESLELSVKGNYEVTVPTFRNDLHIPADLIEEIGRIHGYNNFPKTLPSSPVPTAVAAYVHNYDFDLKVRHILKGLGYCETYTYSLVSKKQLELLNFDPKKVFKVINPISSDYEYMRPTLFGNLLDSIKANQANFNQFKIFEFGKVYQGPSLEKAEEPYLVWTATVGSDFYNVKGDLEVFLNQIGAKLNLIPCTDQNWLHPGRSALIEFNKENVGVMGEVAPGLLAKWGIKDRVLVWSINLSKIAKSLNTVKKYQPLSKYPAVVEDLTLNIPDNVLVGDVAGEIWKTSDLVVNIELISVHENNYSFRITYQSTSQNLTDTDVSKLRTKILKELKEELKVIIKM